ncbi:MAG: hypothetical protein AAB296_08375 [Candidatus Desantisbacteria bacterium]
MICPHCGYEKNAEDALYCNLCHVSFCKKDCTKEMPLQETQKKDAGERGKGEEGEKNVAKKIATIDDLPDELKARLLKEKDAIVHSKGDNFMDSKKMILIGLLFGFILLMVGGIFVLLPVMRTILMKGQG